MLINVFLQFTIKCSDSSQKQGGISKMSRIEWVCVWACKKTGAAYVFFFVFFGNRHQYQHTHMHTHVLTPHLSQASKKGEKALLSHTFPTHSFDKQEPISFGLLSHTNTPNTYGPLSSPCLNTAACFNADKCTLKHHPSFLTPHSVDSLLINTYCCSSIQWLILLRLSICKHARFNCVL